MKIVNKKRFSIFIAGCFLIVLGLVYSCHHATAEPSKDSTTPYGCQVEWIENCKDGTMIYHFDNGKSKIFGVEPR